MFNRLKQSIEKLTYNGTVDGYGQLKKDTPTSTSIEGVVKQYNQQNTDDARFVDIDYIVLVKDTSVTDANRLKWDNKTYDIKYIIPSKRYTQIFVKLHK